MYRDSAQFRNSSLAAEEVDVLLTGATPAFAKHRVLRLVGCVLGRRPTSQLAAEYSPRHRWANHRADRAKGDRMALGFYITAKGFTQERYDTTLVQLEEAGAGAPDGRISHVALETDGEIQVFDVWESQEAFDAFGVTLLPILAAAGVEMNEPMVARVHNEIKG